MKAIKNLFSSKRKERLALVHCRCCGKSFEPEFEHQPCCSSACVRRYNHSSARVRRPHAEAHPPRQPVGRPQHTQGAQYVGHHSARPSAPPGHTTRPSPPPAAPATAQYYHTPANPHPPAYGGGVVPRPAPHHNAPAVYPARYPADQVQYPTGFTPPPQTLSALPPQVVQMSRTSSNPAQPRARPRPRRQDVPQRPSSAGHTPGTALKPLPVVFTDPWAENAAQDSHKRDDTHRLRHPSRKDVSEARAPSRPQAMPTGVAPSPTRTQAMPAVVAPSPTRAQAAPVVAAPSPIRVQGTTTIFAPSPIRPLSLRTVAGSRLKGFGTPILSDISSESGANDEEPHGGFYDAQGYPVKGPQGTAEGQTIESPSSAGWKTASTATLVPTPRARKHEVRTPAYQCGNYALYHLEGSVTPRPKTATRRAAPRPRSNSFGGY